MLLRCNAQNMKRFQLLFIITLLISVDAHAQLNKKMWLIGGTGSFQSYKEVFDMPLPPVSQSWTDYHNEIDISVKVGYFVIDKLVLGLTPTFVFLKSSSSTYPLSENNIKLMAGPFARFYFLDKNKPFNLLAEVNYQAGIQGMINNPKEKGSTRSFSLMIGPEIFFNSVAGVEVLLGYKASKESMDGSYDPHTDIRKGFQVTIGFQVHLKNFKISQF